MINIKKIFKSNHPVIGVIHFMPSPGFEGYTDINISLKNALHDLEALEDGGADGIIIENNYDLPHTIEVTSETIAYMTYLGTKIREKTTLPMGVSVLWNDYKSAFSIAKTIRANFIRIPVFVDDVITDFGEVHHTYEDSLAYRKKIEADDIAIFADIQVKHSKMLNSKKTLEESYLQAVKERADAVIITGQWTGDPPRAETLSKLNKISKIIPIFVGSGVNKENIRSLSKEAYGFIVSTSLKSGHRDSKQRNIMKYEARIEQKKVEELMMILNLN